MHFLLLPFLSLSSFYYNLNEEKAFVSWMKETNHIYTGDEYHLRFGIFLTNMRFVNSHNKRKDTKFSVCLNKFATLTPAEYKAKLNSMPFIKSNSKIINKNSNTNKQYSTSTSIDWREKGAVNAIQDMGDCQGDWAFSGVATAESSNFIAHSKLWKFSEQSFIDCDTQSHACSYGAPFTVFDYVYTHTDGKFMLSTDYPYVGYKQKCKYDVSKAVGTLKDIVSIELADENDLALKCETYGPVAASIDGSHASFQLYSSGIYDDPKCDELNVNLYLAIVGFGIEGETEYWIVRNSWGASWGEEGYIRMIKGMNNRCGYATSSCLPVS